MIIFCVCVLTSIEEIMKIIQELVDDKKWKNKIDVERDDEENGDDDEEEEDNDGGVRNTFLVKVYLFIS